jgi:hypothetical protein
VDNSVDRGLGTVLRIVDDSLAYAALPGPAYTTLTFGPLAVEGFRGQGLAELNVREGTDIELRWDQSTGVVTRAQVSEANRGGLARPLGPTRTSAGSGGSSGQNELLPDASPVGTIRVTRALPVETRAFGKLIDCERLRPGDLMLTRDILPDWTGKLISGVQKKGGYSEPDSRWTHAAMYLGDCAHVVEATFNSPLEGGDVRLTTLDDYCKGGVALRFRRSRFVTSDLDGWKICVRAMSRLRKPYSFARAIDMWFRTVVRGAGFFDDGEKYPVSSAVICSTLYADAYNEVTRRSLGEVSGACVPAWLSAAGEFEDIGVQWLKF